MKSVLFDRNFSEISSVERIAGGDEVGRGALAGPVVVAIVLMNYEAVCEGVRDSKQLSPSKREKLSIWIRQNAVDYSIGQVEPEVIDRINILEATRLAFRQAYEQLRVKPKLLLLDALHVGGIPVEQRAIIKGDTLSYAIGAASILAKVYRDRLMENYGRLYPDFNFHSNKGYGTKHHRDLLLSGRKWTPIHRKSFYPVSCLESPSLWANT